MIKKVIKIGSLLLLFVPLVVLKSTYFPFVFSKTIVFQVGVEFLFLLFLIWWWKNNPSLRSKTRLLVLAYLISIAVATLFSISPVRSFFSTQERMTGLFTYLHLGVYFLLLSLFLEGKDWDWFFAIPIASGFLALILFFLNDRGANLFGNVGFMANYLLYGVFFALRFIQKRKNLFLRILLVAFICSSLLFFVKTRRRSGLFSFGVGFLVFLMFRIKEKDTLFRGLVLVGALLLGFVLVWVFREEFFANMEPRIISWKMSWSAFKDRPILGVGPENYLYVFAKYFIPEYSEHSSSWFDKAHNGYLESLTTMGLVGFFAYMILLGHILWLSFKKKKFLILSLLVALLVNNLFWFKNTTSLMLFFGLIAFLDHGDS